jgi:hypothetical protein
MEVSHNLDSIGCGVNNKTLTYIIIMALPDMLLMLKSILCWNGNPNWLIKQIR